MLKNRLQAFLSKKNLTRLQKISQPALNRAPEVKRLSDAELKERFHSLKHSDKENLSEALAIVREAAYRALGMEPYEVQLQGAAALFQGVVVEMKTGEGKTLTVALAAAIAGASKEGVHVATVNPYLAQRDAESMQPLYQFLGLTVGVTLPGQSTQEKQQAYAADITYGVHSELGFDYLRDHLVAKLEDRVQRELSFVIVDEADSILIDEARTPLIISQPSNIDGNLYQLADAIVRVLKVGEDFDVDEKLHLATLTEKGLDKVEGILLQQNIIAHKGALYEAVNLHFMRYLNAAMKAYSLFRRDRDYIVRDGSVQIIDGATGRILEGRQWQEGLHQAIEAKERVEIKPENETAAEITYQSLFRLYKRLAGLTGTAQTSAEEFESMYGLIVVPIPTHRPVVRNDLPDQLFRSKNDKFKAIVSDIAERTAKGQPILVGTASVKESDELSLFLNKAGIAHNVLNARQNEQEAQIIADAGLPGTVTVATNMAGRGTDIVLGGHTEKDEAWKVRHAKVLEAGGLHVIGTTRNESRRVDDQLRGRAGRQGDPGSSQFYLCLEDDLLRIFGSDRVARLFDLAGITTDALQGPMLDKAVGTAQRRVEGQHFESRKNLAKFDGVMAEQREAVYSLRRSILEGSLEVEYCYELVEEGAQTLFEAYIERYDMPENWKVKELKQALEQDFGPTLPVIKWAMVEDLEYDEMLRRVKEGCIAYYKEKREQEEGLSERERLVLVSVLDQLWRAHLTHLDGLRDGIHLRSYAQQDPATAFRKEAYDSFVSFRKNLVIQAAAALTFAFRAPAQAPAQATTVIEVPAEHVEETATSTEDAPNESQAWPQRRISRNERCPCGSGLRFKHCHGKLK